MDMLLYTPILDKYKSLDSLQGTFSDYGFLFGLLSNHYKLFRFYWLWKGGSESWKKNYQFTQTARGEDKESKFKVATRSKYVIISLLNQDVVNLILTVFRAVNIVYVLSSYFYTPRLTWWSLNECQHQWYMGRSVTVYQLLRSSTNINPMENGGWNCGRTGRDAVILKENSCPHGCSHRWIRRTIIVKRRK